jgi:hypothetical protein
MSTPNLHPKQTAALIRKLLKAQFPSTKFSVVTERGSMVSSVRIAWTDGPTTRRVDALVACFEAGHFDGMTDSYEYDSSRHLIVDGERFRPGTRYIFTSRTISATLAQRCIAQIVHYWGGIDVAPAAVEGTLGYKLEPELGWTNIRPDLYLQWNTAIHRAAADRSEYRRETTEETSEESVA